jgi:formylglycine-generating enzyme required for sulfatase activity
MSQGTPSLPTRRLIISRQTHQGRYFTERLDDNTTLDLMLILGGSFQMGQTAAEAAELVRQVGEKDYQNYYASELPQHLVTVPPFFMGKSPIVQAQWRVVAGYDRVDRGLDPNPSDFKGDNRPVENVSWDDATEFCRRLSHRTGRSYRLPSEAEWEYACRAGTTTPFHVGETLSDELANYCAQDREISGELYQGTYDRGILGQYRKETTPVEQFPVNPFGLHDMHGNVWEWCEDDWHPDYTGAPSDGSAWVKVDRVETSRLLRGGSWIHFPRRCRSAYRLHGSRDIRDHDVGFRVCCAPPRILSP